VILETISPLSTPINSYESYGQGGTKKEEKKGKGEESSRAKVQHSKFSKPGEFNSFP